MGIKYIGEARVLSAATKPYDFTDDKGQKRTGESHLVRLNIDGEIYAIKSTKEQVDSILPHVGKDVLVEVDVNSPKEVVRLVLKSVEAS